MWICASPREGSEINSCMKYLLGRSAENLMAVIYAFSMAYDPQIIKMLCRTSWKVSPGQGNTSVRCRLASAL